MECRIKKTTEWKVRMIHEASFHQHNQFVTLTYDPENLPYGSDLIYSHVQNFLKAVRQQYGEVRFFCAGEYGSNYGRPHWHLIIYGLNLTDLEQNGTGSRGDPLYSSQKLEQIWDKGRVWVGEVNPTTCAYVAGYALKDTGAKHAENYEILVPETGEIVQRKKPFIRMSNGGGKAKIKGGIGARWREQFLADCRKGYITFNGQPVSLPSYYLKLLELEYPEDYEKIKAQRETWATSPSRRAEQTPERRQTRETILQHEEKRNRGNKKAVIAATFVEKPKRIKKKDVEKEISKLAPVAKARQANADEQPEEAADEDAA
jgi:hypothetical protein